MTLPEGFGSISYRYDKYCVNFMTESSRQGSTFKSIYI